MFDLLTGITSPESPVAPDVELLALARGLLVQGRKCRQRRTLVIAGESNWCRDLASSVSRLPELKRVIWVSSKKNANMEVLDASTVKKMLGQECDAVVFDAFSGFDPDAFGAISGTICAGGLLILLCPPFSKWERFADPAGERIAISPFSYKDISGRFIRRLVGVIRNAAGVTIIEQHSIEQNKPLPVIESAVTYDESLYDLSNDECRTENQESAVEAIEHVMHGHRRRPAVLVSDRGRGKSAALGIAAARLLIKANSQSDKSKNAMRIVVTAPRPGAVESLFSHALRVLQQVLPEIKLVENTLRFKGSQIQYIAPDVLCSLQEPVDLVLVDEAAAIPVSLLTQYLKKYSRIAFATTVHGYEGTGRGFAVRFRKTLDEKTPGWNEVRLQTPIRWAENDPLESLVFRSLLLDAGIAEEKEVTGANAESVSIECLDREALVNDEQTLSQLFGLLVTAHYRTTPNDLRNLLDGPGVSVYVMRSRSLVEGDGLGHVIATALVSAEGEFSDELTDAIFSGQRRPRGHLIPQSLLTHAGIKQAAKLRCARIMRIAVHPALQGKGLGSKLVDAIRSESKAQGYNLIGVSFGAAKELMRFWEVLGLYPVRVGFRRDHASGEHSVMMLAALDKKGDEVYRTARSRLLADLPYWLLDSLQDLDCNVAAECLRNGNPERFTLNGLDEQAVVAFSRGARSYEDCSAALWRFTVTGLMNPEHRLQKLEQDLLVARVLQKRSWAEVATMCDLTGRAEVVNALRNATSSLLKNRR